MRGRARAGIAGLDGVDEAEEPAEHQEKDQRRDEDEHVAGDEPEEPDPGGSGEGGGHAAEPAQAGALEGFGAVAEDGIVHAQIDELQIGLVELAVEAAVGILAAVGGGRDERRGGRREERGGGQIAGNERLEPGAEGDILDLEVRDRRASLGELAGAVEEGIVVRGGGAVGHGSQGPGWVEQALAGGGNRIRASRGALRGGPKRRWRGTRRTSGGTRRMVC